MECISFMGLHIFYNRFKISKKKDIIKCSFHLELIQISHSHNPVIQQV